MDVRNELGDPKLPLIPLRCLKNKFQIFGPTLNKLLMSLYGGSTQSELLLNIRNEPGDPKLPKEQQDKLGYGKTSYSFALLLISFLRVLLKIVTPAQF